MCMYEVVLGEEGVIKVGVGGSLHLKVVSSQRAGSVDRILISNKG